MIPKSFVSVLSFTIPAAFALDNGFGRTPVLGFNTYNDIACSPNQTYISATLDAFKTKGLLAAGYKYFQLDCGWQGFERQANGSITYDASVFPQGIAPLSKKARDLGYQWSMYTDQGVNSCDTIPGRPGSLGFEEQDAAQFAAWNVAYMKIDNCYIEAGQNAPKDPRTDFPSRFGKISTALQNVGIKGISICQWGTPYASPTGLEGPSQWTAPISNGYRLSDDIIDSWQNIERIYNQAIHIILLGRSGPGRFADMDLLEVGNAGLSSIEQASHFAIWAMFKSPLMVSTAVPTMSDATVAILSNRNLLSINQDPLGEPVKLVQRFTNDRDVFVGNLSNGDKAVLVVDHSNTTRTMTIDFKTLGIRLANVKDAWTGQTQADSRTYSARVGAHGNIALRLSNVRLQTVTEPKLTWIEAESGTLSGNANKQSCTGCSGSSKVGNVGKDGTLTLSGIKTSQSTQDVRFDYINCEINYTFAMTGRNARGASITVNGGVGQSVLFPITGYNWDRDVTKSYLVRLAGFKTSGTNTISITGLSEDTTYAPDFDRIGVVA
ncbi:related to Alpha-N-acetylgalactosaminidase precursor [Ramularia collo-cygni]|uniref:Alpha-galactosidase n=1 Tax=Ramularia collo-cygni TaxID=112498 RepID=A0A2D3UPV5_9PEZI|nr:related to Alpha-N-acetylgalactosaminidase precursor [Ramularia collo-cygni]CZT16078.1 related to Alpha-N-acetylgalactosaminidase precursor [Ramularia collo-cygni]